MAYRHPQITALSRLHLWMVALIVVSLVALLGAFFVPQSASAAEEERETTEELSAEANEDADVTLEDLEAEEVRVLPDSPLYGFKRFGRALRETFTFNPIAKAEVRLEHANLELAEAQQLLEERPEDSAAARATAKAVERYEDRIEKISDKVEDLSERREDGDEVRVGKLIEKFVDKQIKHRKVIEKLERRIDDHASDDVRAEVRDRLAESRDRVAEHAGKFIGNIDDDSERLAGHIQNALDDQDGSEFRDFKNVEVLRHFEDHVSDEAKDAFRQAEGHAIDRLAENFKKLPKEKRARSFDSYVTHIYGDETVHMELFDRLEQEEDLPEDIRERMETAKDIAARRFQERIEGVGEQYGEEYQDRFRERTLQRFTTENPDLGQLRAVQEIRERVEFKDEEIRREVEIAEEESVRQFAAQFTDTESQDQVSRYQELSRQMQENPDPTTFRLLQALEEEVKSDPSKKAFIERLEYDTKAEFAQRASEDGDDFLEQITSLNPHDLEVYEQLRREFGENPDEFFGPPPSGEFGSRDDEFGDRRPEFEGPPPGFENFFEQAKQHQSERITDHLRDIEDPELFESFENRFRDLDEGTLNEIKARQSDFEGTLSERRDFSNERELEADERRVREELDVERRRLNEEFDARVERAGNEEDRQAIFNQRIDEENRLNDRELEARKQQFEARISSDSLCDERCQQAEREQFRIRLDEERRSFDEDAQLRRDQVELDQFPQDRDDERREENNREDGPEVFNEDRRFDDDRRDGFEGGRFDGPPEDDGRRFDIRRPDERPEPSRSDENRVDEKRSIFEIFRPDRSELESRDDVRDDRREAPTFEQPRRPEEVFERFEERRDDVRPDERPPEPVFETRREDERSRQPLFTPPEPERQDESREEVRSEERRPDLRPLDDIRREDSREERIQPEVREEVREERREEPSVTAPVQITPPPSDVGVPPPSIRSRQSSVQGFILGLFTEMFAKSALAGW